MGEIFRKNGYSFMIYSLDHDPAHIHVRKAEHVVKIELETWNVTQNSGFKSRDVKKIIKIAKENEDILWEKWNEIHG